MNDLKGHLTAAQAAKLRGCTSQTIARKCREGLLPGATMVGTMWLIPRKSVERLQLRTYPDTERSTWS